MHPGDPGRWTRLDWLLAAVAALAAVAPRVVLRDHGIFDIDSALLAQGVRSFDFASYHPHPPYHPLTIATAKVLATWLAPADALTWVSLASVVVLAAAVFGIGRALAGRLAGAYAAVLLALSPLVTENVGVALSYSNEPAAVAVVALLALRARARRDVWSWVALGVAASVAVGVRPSAVITAGPLVLWAAGRDLRALARAGAAGAATTVAWLVPTVIAGGGWAAFRYGNDYQTRLYVLHDPVWRAGGDAVANNLAWLAHHVRVELAWIAAVAALSLVCALPLWLGRARRRGFLIVWAGPLLLFYGLVYGGWPLFHSGYALGALPPAFVGGAVALRRVHDAIQARVDDVPLRIGAVMVVTAIAVLPLAWPADWDEALQPRADAQAWIRSWDGLEEELPPERTAILTGYSGSWVRLEHPGYLTWVVEAVVDDHEVARLQVQEVRDGVSDKPFFTNERDGADDAPHPIPDWVEEIAVIEGHPLDGPPSLAGLPVKREVVLPGGARVVILDAHAVGTIEEAIQDFGRRVQVSHEMVWPPR